MSLINEALKKAQRQRHEEGADPTNATPGIGGGGHVTRRGKPDGSNTVVLLGSGALVLVVLSVVFTVYLVNRPTDSKRIATSSSASASTAKTAVSPTPAPTPAAPVDSTPPIVVPKITPSNPTAPSSAPLATDSPVTSAPTSTASAPAATPASRPSPVATVTTTPVAPATAPSTTPTAAPPGTPATTPATVPAAAETLSPAAALPPGTPDERVAAFVDSIRVTGIRSSGAESRVLMNERVYRVNDVVERNLGVRLVKAAADSLTFSDPRGVTYVKNF
jgi:hypothetical protein